MSLKETLEQYQNAKKLADMDTSALPYRTRPAIEIAVGEARQKVVFLRKEYEEGILTNAVGCFVSGPPESESKFSILGAQIGKTLTIKGDQFYRNVADRVEANFPKDRGFNPDTFATLVSAVRAEVAGTLEVVSMPSMKYIEAFLATSEDVFNFCRDRIREAFGDELNGLFLRKSLVDTALAMGYAENVTPAVVTGCSLGEVATLGRFVFKAHSFVKLGEEVTEEQVREQFSFVAKQYTANKKKKG